MEKNKLGRHFAARLQTNAESCMVASLTFKCGVWLKLTFVLLARDIARGYATRESQTHLEMRMLSPVQAVTI
jgi:hypothetical protein